MRDIVSSLTNKIAPYFSNFRLHRKSAAWALAGIVVGGGFMNVVRLSQVSQRNAQIEFYAKDYRNLANAAFNLRRNYETLGKQSVDMVFKNQELSDQVKSEQARAAGLAVQTQKANEDLRMLASKIQAREDAERTEEARKSEQARLFAEAAKRREYERQADRTSYLTLRSRN